MTTPESCPSCASLREELEAARETVKRHGIAARRLGNELEGMTRSRDTAQAKLDAFIKSEGRAALRAELAQARVLLRDVLMVCAGYLRTQDPRLLADARAALSPESEPK